MKLKDYPHMTPEELGRLKGALRRYFARPNKGKDPSIYQIAQERNRIEHSDPKHPKCKKWSWCDSCGLVLPTWRTAVDHIVPFVPIESHFEELTITEAFERLRCSLDNLQVLCEDCHERKTKEEKQARKPFTKPKNKKCST